jgi:hypothetical protein
MKINLKSKISCQTPFKHDIVCDLPQGLQRAQGLPRRFAANGAGLTGKQVGGEKYGNMDKEELARGQLVFNPAAVS